MKTDAQALVEQFLKELPNDLPEFMDFPKVSVNTCSHFGNTPLHVAAIRNDIESVKALIACGADVNAVGELGYTPLHEAYEQGHPEVVEILLANGAAPDARNDDNWLPHELAEIDGEDEDSAG